MQNARGRRRVWSSFVSVLRLRIIAARP